jgi:small GTP-binding protein
MDVIVRFEGGFDRLTKPRLFETYRRSFMPKVKTVFAGESGVGKTCIIEYAAHNAFKANQYSTIGATNATVKVDCEIKGKQQTVIFNIWDTAGQEKYRSLAPMYFAGAHLAVLVFDITQRSSLQALDEFFELFRQRAPDDCVYVLVGNKTDLDSERQVQTTEAEDYRMKMGADFYFETSALKGHNIKEIFVAAATSGLTFEPEQPDYLQAIEEDGQSARAKKQPCDC